MNHDYQRKIVKPTCEKDGYTRYVCARCGDSYTKNRVEKLLHWYGEWTSDDSGAHSAVCCRENCEHISKADCQMLEYLIDGEVLRFCPVCGKVENGERLERVENASADGDHPNNCVNL